MRYDSLGGSAFWKRKCTLVMWLFVRDFKRSNVITIHLRHEAMPIVKHSPSFLLMTFFNAVERLQAAFTCLQAADNKVCFRRRCFRTWRVHIADKPPGLGAFSHEDTEPVAYNYHLLWWEMDPSHLLPMNGQVNPCACLQYIIA